MKAEFERSRKTYGSPWIKMEFDSKGIPIGKHRAVKLMKEAVIKARKPRKFKVTTDSAHKLEPAPNLVERRFNELASAPNRLWVSDLTYIWTQQGCLYLCVFLDVYSRKVVAYSIDDTMEVMMVNDALKMALRRRTSDEGLIIHSDQGAQYAGSEFRGILKAFNAIQNISRKGDCWDNAVAESLFATIKGELIDRQHWISKAHARLAIVEWIECFYNNQRGHSSIGGVCPVEYEFLTNTTQAS